eukprot:CAMPEP_0174250890 /NCGR_PEP_ID=MMETSP0439-20130205/909_1 /TAXON_ID=0 /ORGANISM="Stereomyxa ramosa, Strain Chinc5" /LENGTH=514 /DNA_ID=CAMNT_0015331069 /DNA_START=133 /DNA_END=1674 /DNA_ORIENTATION=+
MIVKSGLSPEEAQRNERLILCCLLANAKDWPTSTLNLIKDLILDLPFSPPWENKVTEKKTMRRSFRSSTKIKTRIPDEDRVASPSSPRNKKRAKSESRIILPSPRKRKITKSYEPKTKKQASKRKLENEKGKEKKEEEEDQKVVKKSPEKENGNKKPKEAKKKEKEDLSDSKQGEGEMGESSRKIKIVVPNKQHSGSSSSSFDRGSCSSSIFFSLENQIGTLSHVGDLFTHQDPSSLFSYRHKIGKGRFGEVFSSEDKENKEEVAIKVFSNKYSKDRYEIGNEVATMQNFDHPNITSFRSTYLFDDTVWIVMELCEFGSLREYVKMETMIFKESEIAYVTHQVLKGLAYIHKQKKVHRDIKSGNILITASGDIKLADFGLCCVYTESKPPSKMAGSRYWMAPEMINRQCYDPTIDVWSTGCVVYEMAQGSPPYYKHAGFKAMYLVSTEGAPALKHQKRFSKNLKEFVSQCLAILPNDRPPPSSLLKHDFLKKRCTNAKFARTIVNSLNRKNVTI